MKENDIRQTLQHADDATAQELTEAYPPSGSEAKERIYAQIQARRSGVSETEPEGTVIESKRQISWKISAIAAAVVIILIPCGLFALQQGRLLPHKDFIQPVTEVQQLSETAYNVPFAADLEGRELYLTDTPEAMEEDRLITPEQRRNLLTALSQLPWEEQPDLLGDYDDDVAAIVTIGSYATDDMAGALYFLPGCNQVIWQRVPTDLDDLHYYAMTDDQWTQITAALAAGISRVDGRPWEEHVLTAEQIGSMVLDDRSHSLIGSEEDGFRDGLTLTYRDPAHPDDHNAEIIYTEHSFAYARSYFIDGNKLSPQLIGTINMPGLSADGGTSFLVDMGSYRVKVIVHGVTEGEFTQLVTLLSESLKGGAENVPHQQLADANAMSYPWKGHIPQTDQFGSLTFSYAIMMQGHSENGEWYDELKVQYDFTGNPQARYVEFTYTLDPHTEAQEDFISGADLSPDLIGTDLIPTPESVGRQWAFFVDMGSYRIFITLNNVTTEELTEIINSLRDAMNGEFIDLPEDTTEETAAETQPLEMTEKAVTWQEAQELSGDLFPLEQMGFAEDGNLMHLQSVQQLQKGAQQAFVLTYKGEDGSTAEIKAAPETDFDAVFDREGLPHISEDEMSMESLKKRAQHTQYDDGTADYGFKYNISDWEMQFRFEHCTEAELEPFADFCSERAGVSNWQTRISPERANSYDAPWKGDVITEPKIGSIPLSKVLLQKPRTTINETVVYLDALYSDPDSDNLPAIIIRYSEESPEALEVADRIITADTTAAALMKDTHFTDDEYIYSCAIDKGAYRVKIVWTSLVTEEELQTVLDLLAK